MELNFTVKKNAPPCENCGHKSEKELILGRYMNGFVFALKLHPDENIFEFGDFMMKIQQEGYSIFDDAGRLWDLEEFGSAISAIKEDAVHWNDATTQTKNNWDLFEGDLPATKLKVVKNFEEC